VTHLEPVEVDGVPASFAVLGLGESEDGGRVLVGFAPRHGGDAALAAWAHGQRLAAEEGFDGEVFAVAPQWSVAARQRLSLLGEPPFAFRALAATALDEESRCVEAEGPVANLPLPAELAARRLTDAPARELYLRALRALQGLAAKHAGTVRGHASGAELVLLARRVAALRLEDGALKLETLQPERSLAALTPEGVSAAMDRLEGQLRKHLNDRRVKSSEEAQRAEVVPGLVAAASLRSCLSWPLGGSDPEVIDLVGLDAEGRPVVAAVRPLLGLPELGAVLDATLALTPALPFLFAGADAPLQLGPPRLALAAEEVTEPARRVLDGLTLDRACFELRSRRGAAAEVVLVDAASGAPRGLQRERAGAPAPARGGAVPAAAASPRGEAPPAPREPRARPAAPEAPEAARTGGSPEDGVEEISLFDLDDDAKAGGSSRPEEGRSRSRRRRRGRRRGRRGTQDEERPASSASSAREDDDEDLDDLLADAVEEDLSATLAPLEVEEVQEEEPARYEDEEDFEEAEAGEDDWAQEREARRRARLAKIVPEPEPEEPQKAPRRRAAILAHADRDAVAAAILLARDIRLIEGFWVYPQSELMTFFRSVATDLRPETPICVVGFTATPARDTLQAAALYRGRLTWYDHHEWPPEDLEALKESLGAENVSVRPGSGSSLPIVLAERSRRSRFSDKLVELVTGRFTEHDYQRWGRLWWQRLSEIASRAGDRRADIDPLMSGRPSDLARQASKADVPALPPEVEYVSSRDFRVVHFGGYGLVVVPVPEPLDLHLVSRLVRERLAVQVALAYREGAELVTLGSDDARGRRDVDLGAMVDHLSAKHAWIEALGDEDHVARMRVRGLATDPERLDEVVAEVAMGRSILEG
jgi:hypothetical protein